MRSVRSKLLTLETKPYFSTEISVAISEQDSLFMKARKMQSKSLMNKAVIKRKEVKILIKRAKRNCVTENIELCKANVNEYWRNMTKLLNRNKTSQIAIILNNQGKLVQGKEAAEINDYFCKKGTELATKVPVAKQSFPIHPVDSIFTERAL